MDNKNDLYQATLMCKRSIKILKYLSLLLVSLTLNIQSTECKSMPIDQQQTLPSVTSKIPILFAGKSHHHHHNQQQQQQHQPHISLYHHHQTQTQQQHYRRQVAATPLSGSPVSGLMNLTGEPLVAKSSASIMVASSAPAAILAATSSSRGIQQQQQQPSSELIQTSASYLNEISARQTRRQPASQPEASANRAAEVDENGELDPDEQDGDDEPRVGPPSSSSSSYQKSMNPSAASKQQFSQSDEDQLIEPTRRQALRQPDGGQTSSRATAEAITRLRYNGPALGLDSQPEVDEQAARREQENAEASEAEVADRSALDEQQQQQREIILAQAQSEAKAIKEQQEALLKQQAMQLQMILRRQDLDGNRGNLSSATGNSNAGHFNNNKPMSSGKQHKHRSHQQRQQYNKMNYDDDVEQQIHSDKRHRQHAGFISKSQDEDTDYSIRQPAVVRHDSSHHHSHQTNPHHSHSLGSIPKYGVSDLLPAAQHSYGVHFAPLHGYQKDYYQFAESFKKGQFHSGYKRGGNKFYISGHASQHKSHAEGHAKWNGYKGKGVSYWNYQHGDNKKHSYDHDNSHHGGYYH